MVEIASGVARWYQCASSFCIANLVATVPDASKVVGKGSTHHMLPVKLHACNPDAIYLLPDFLKPGTKKRQLPQLLGGNSPMAGAAARTVADAAEFEPGSDELERDAAGNL